MSDLITYDDKIRLKSQNVSDKYKVTAEDMNEIKRVVNNNGELVDNKLDVLDVLNEPSADTDKPYSADYLNDKLVSVGTEEPENGERVWFSKSKNLLQNKLTTQTIDGVTFTKNTDETILVNGTATADISLYFSDYLTLAEGQYILTGCPSGGSSATYSMVLQGVARDTGSGKTFTSVTNRRVILEIKSGTTCNNLLFKPMIAEGSTAITYEPYIDPSINVDGEKWYNKPKVLWTNPNPTSSFASQTITLSESITNYKYYEILYKTYKDENIGYNTGKIPVEWSTNLYGITNANDGGTRSRVRQVTINNSTQIAFASCSLINTKGDAYTFPDNDRLIPYQILGYK